jgi:hypothetical protein
MVSASRAVNARTTICVPPSNEDIGSWWQCATVRAIDRAVQARRRIHQQVGPGLALVRPIAQRRTSSDGDGWRIKGSATESVDLTK